ncbi:TMEM165/GDT1 family protein [Aeromicrobium duanguangcaii]|uniref:GDT1 family protein n=1 Tax=Aeromicrobium duanguangcaii TaxID=2968086 RepID=A0ABY5KMH4_9ACTN|nr:TMEM165/GDT1 family protein [Aeromicrobium duanguangcaii]MCD9153374.1 TMEM165/GDT1 family protein [Aeromicrobium duanguangcaii]UUI69533.1 TMEM165/GDT1 family protein [Aeromicrobium duanguangcaii]
MEAVFIAAALVFVAELGDKSQLMAMTFATRFRARTVILGMGIACAIINLASALVGEALGSFIPEHVLQIVAGVVFLVFAAITAWSLRGSEDEEEIAVVPHSRRALITVGLAFTLAELGDKTMFATMTLATQYSWVWVWIGSTAGMLLSIILAVLLGKQILKVLPVRAVHAVAAVLFAALGIWLLLG